MWPFIEFLYFSVVQDLVRFPNRIVIFQDRSNYSEQMSKHGRVRVFKRLFNQCKYSVSFGGNLSGMIVWKLSWSPKTIPRSLCVVDAPSGDLIFSF